MIFAETVVFVKITEQALELLERTEAAKRPVRLLGVGVHRLLCGVDEAPRQQIYLGDEAFVERMQALAEPRLSAGLRK